MNQAFPSGEDAQYAIIESRVLGLAEQATRIERALRQLEEDQEELAELPGRCRPLRRRARAGAGHLPKGVKFYVIGGGLGLLGLVFGLPQDHPARVVMMRTVDYFAQQVQLPEVPPSMGLVAMLPGQIIPELSAQASGSQNPTARANPSPPPTGAQRRQHSSDGSSSCGTSSPDGGTDDSQPDADPYPGRPAATSGVGQRARGRGAAVDPETQTEGNSSAHPEPDPSCAAADAVTMKLANSIRDAMLWLDRPEGRSLPQLLIWVRKDCDHPATR